MHFIEAFRTSQVNRPSVVNSRLASPDISNVQNANVHARFHSSITQEIPLQLQHTHFNGLYDSCSNTVASPQQTCHRVCTERDD